MKHLIPVLASLALLLAGCGDEKQITSSGVIFTVDGKNITQAKRTILPTSKKKDIKESMTLRELVEIFGPGWTDPHNGLVYVIWTFDDNSKVTFLGMPNAENIDKRLKLVSKDQWIIDKEFK